MPDPIQLVECPRDAMQGLSHFIPTATKIAYLNALLKVGFHTLDFGSFVSPRAVPQLRDTAEVLAGLDLSATRTGLLAIVANRRGAEEAAGFGEITQVGFPLSVSETFQRRNTNKSVAEALLEVTRMQELCEARGKTLVVYLSMGFGNPYGDPYSPALVVDCTGRLVEMGVRIIAPSDTVGSSTPAAIAALFGQLIPAFPAVTFGAHLHSVPAAAAEKVEAAYEAGCRRFDGAVRGYGGCPMATDQLIGNIATESLLAVFEKRGIGVDLDVSAFGRAWQLSAGVFAPPA